MTPLRLVALTTLVAGSFVNGACSSTKNEATPGDAGVPDEDAGAETEDAGFPCPPNGISKGPWSLAMTRTGVKVRWEACRAEAAGGIVFRPETGGADVAAPSATTTHAITTLRRAILNPRSPDDVPGTYINHEAALTALTPGTCYRYELAADRTLGGRFCTSKPDGAAVHFLAIADTNPLLGPATEKLLGHVLPRGPDFTVHAGDIQYYASGVETWAGWFPAMRPLLAQGAMIAAIGNHEHEYEGADYDDYNVRFFGDDAQGGRDAYFRFESGGVHLFALNSELPLAPESKQGSWLTGALAEASRSPGFRTSILFMHRPFVTCGDKSQEDDLRTRYTPIFVQNKVSLIFQAHMHAYERFELDGLTWVTTGGGGGLLGKVDENMSRAECASRKSAGAYFHAVDVTVEGKQLRALAVDDAGQTRDSFTLGLP